MRIAAGVPFAQRRLILILNQASRRHGRGERTGQRRKIQHRHESIGIFDLIFSAGTLQRTPDSLSPSPFSEADRTGNRIALEKIVRACYYSRFSSSQEAFPEAPFKYAPRQSQRKRAV
jgi:hypothetical protein